MPPSQVCPGISIEMDPVVKVLHNGRCVNQATEKCSTWSYNRGRMGEQASQ